MYIANAASLRSSALGRQVGCSISDADGETLVTGMNDVARAGGGQYWEGDSGDGRDFTLGLELSDKMNVALVEDLVRSFHERGWFTEEISQREVADVADEAVREGGPASTSQILDILEFGRIVHAEMAAISTAARRGVPLRGSTLYTTTFPCHQCARHIVASGIDRVVYREPYPKSKVGRLFRDSITLGASLAANRVGFRPFEGIAPARFTQLFEKAGAERKGTGGDLRDWVIDKALPKLAAEDVASESLVRDRELTTVDRLNDLLDEYREG